MDRRGPVDLAGYDRFFEGKHFAVGLRTLRTNREDRHLAFSVMYKDDDGYGNPQWWFVSNHYIGTDHGVTSAYLEDLATVTAEALAWCKANCDPDTVPLLSGKKMIHGWALK
jgi:hypothetical protein